MITGGIIDFDSLMHVCDKVKLDYVELIQIFNELNNQILDEKSYCKGNELSFLYDKYCNQLNELNKINNKIQNYYLTIHDLILGYKSEQEEITRSMHLYLNKLREEMK